MELLDYKGTIVVNMPQLPNLDMAADQLTAS